MNHSNRQQQHDTANVLTDCMRWIVNKTGFFLRCTTKVEWSSKRKETRVVIDVWVVLISIEKRAINNCRCTRLRCTMNCDDLDCHSSLLRLYFTFQHWQLFVSWKKFYAISPPIYRIRQRYELRAAIIMWIYSVFVLILKQQQNSYISRIIVVS